MPASNPAEDIQFYGYPGRVRASFAGLTLADSRQVIQINEGNLDPVFYFPREDVRMDLLVATDHHSYCPFRGEASYWSLKDGGDAARNLAWSYPQPFAEAREIGGHLAFYRDRVQLLFEAGDSPPGDVRPENRTAANPLNDWLLGEAAGAHSTRDLIERFIRALDHSGIPVWRFWLSLRTLHPQLYSTAWYWEQGQGEVAERSIGYEIIGSEAFRNSPLVPILEGAGGLRRRLDIDAPQLDYPIVKDLHAAGASDYVAMPILFSDGQINVLSLASKQAGGFSAENLACLYEILPLFSRLVELHAARSRSISLLETYLGKHTGSQVLDGQIRRGDGKDIHAVIWFCDLRNSTGHAEALSREDFLALLNSFFDCLAGAVLEHGGEVLRFIGDAALAIFPIQAHGGEDATASACAAALAAAREAERRIAAENDRRAGLDQAPVEFGIGLHVGEVTYGNIGTGNRLEFTVIGAAANEAARIEGLSKELGHNILLSGDFARNCGDELLSLGRHRLRGVARALEIFALADTRAGG